LFPLSSIQQLSIRRSL